MFNIDKTERTPFQIKNFSVASRHFVLTNAKKQGLTVGEWLERAVQSQVKIEADEYVSTPVDFAQLRDMMQAAHAVARASGKLMSKDVAARLYRLVDAHVRAATLPGR